MLLTMRVKGGGLLLTITPSPNPTPAPAGGCSRKISPSAVENVGAPNMCSFAAASVAEKPAIS
jgi:hypothetical protein